MPRTAQKNSLRVALKVAIVTSKYRHQRVVALKARMPEGRLSNIVCGFKDASPSERKRLARALDTTVEALFPVTDDTAEEAVAS